MSQVLYRMYDTAGDLLYVGITLHIGGRFDFHRRTKPWWTDVARIDLEHFQDRASVEEAERRAVVNEAPKFNVRFAPAPARPDRVAAPSVRRTPQRTFAIDDELWADVRAIAKTKRTRIADLARSALVAYRLQNQALLDELKRAEAPDSATGT